MKKITIKDTIELLGFQPEKDNKDKYFKEYPDVNYTLNVRLDQEFFDYGSVIKKGDETTSNFQNAENLVVLECVDQLLSKGYNPKDITLEKKWKLGRTGKSGKADITITGLDGKTLILIECKTYGKEFEKEKTRMQENGGQLFSYFQQDKNTRFLCLYASIFFGNRIERQQAILRVEDSNTDQLEQDKYPEKIISYAKAGTIDEMLSVWSYKTGNEKNYLTSGIFENSIPVYLPGYTPLKKADLKNFEREHIEGKSGVFNQFEEILRHNNISDRSNAFNRMISLILSKLTDEEKQEGDILEFQILEGGETQEQLIDKLQKLYARAMDKFLKEKVVDHTLEEIENEIRNFPRQAAKNNLLKIYTDLKYYKNNEFAFKEVYNQPLFRQNIKVLEEIIRLFQPFRFRYNQKSQFLGDFFELLLESGYKQSEGQFFTPTPITYFILSSIPIKKIVYNKLENEELSFLPNIVDFACGSGHFLTEAIEQVTSVIQDIPSEYEHNYPQLANWRNNTLWAGECVFGIEKDYRLARTSKVACFMHGDGEARVIFGDGLEKHEDLLPDGTYDVLVANPPYTVKYFKQHLNENKLPQYDLLNNNFISNESDDIEVLFIERMKQLLRSGGMAGIILPSSILSNTGIYTKAREIILKHFEIKSIVEFGSETFSATGTNTVTLFLKKRHPDFVLNCEYIAEDYILGVDFERRNDFFDSRNFYRSYVEILNLDFDDYVQFTKRSITENFLESAFYKNYFQWYEKLTSTKEYHAKLDKDYKNQLRELEALTDENEIAIKKEIVAKIKAMNQRLREERFIDAVLRDEVEKFNYFLLTHREVIYNENVFRTEEIESHDKHGNTVITKIKHYQKSFVPQQTLVVKTGKSNAEQKEFLGYKFSNRRGYKGMEFNGDTSLFDVKNKFNPLKVNNYVYKAFNDEMPGVRAELSENLFYVTLSDCISFDKVDFDKRINPSYKSKTPTGLLFDSPFNESMLNIADLQKGTSITKINTSTGNIPVVAGGKESAYYHNVHNRQGNIITISASGAYAGFINYWSSKIFASDCTTIKSKDETKISTKLIYIILKSAQEKLFSLQRGQAQPHVYSKDLGQIRIPVPPLKVQQQIVSEIDRIDQKEKETKQEILTRINSLKQNYQQKQQAWKRISLSSVVEIIGGGTPSTKIKSYWNGDIPWLSVVDFNNDERWVRETEKKITKEGFENSSTKFLAPGDLIISARGTVGALAQLAIPMTFNQSCYGLRSKEGLSNDFLYFSLRHEIQQFTENATGTVFDAITKTTFQNITIPLPDIETQLAFAGEMSSIEDEIHELKLSVSSVEEDKTLVLNKYLSAKD